MVKLNLHDYLNVIKQPADLGTIQTRLIGARWVFRGVWCENFGIGDTAEHALVLFQITWSIAFQTFSSWKGVDCLSRRLTHLFTCRAPASMQPPNQQSSNHPLALCACPESMPARPSHTHVALMPFPTAGDHYESVHAAIREVRLVWSNARLYNGRSSQISKAADRLEGVFEDALAAAQSGRMIDFGAGYKDEDVVVLRTVPIGSDRLGRLYFFDQAGSRLVVEDDEALAGYKQSYYSTREEIEALSAFLDVKIREDKELLEWLSRNGDAVIGPERQLSGAAAASASAVHASTFVDLLGQLTHNLKSSVEAIPQAGAKPR